jgi:hypothetical protein
MSAGFDSFTVGDTVEDTDTGSQGVILKVEVNVDRERVEYFIHGDDFDDTHPYTEGQLSLVVPASNDSIRGLIDSINGLDVSEEEDDDDSEDDEENDEDGED